MLRRLERITLAGVCALLAAGAVVSGALALTRASHRHVVASAGPAAADAAVVAGVEVAPPVTPVLALPASFSLPVRVVHPRRLVVVASRGLRARADGAAAAGSSGAASRPRSGNAAAQRRREGTARAPCRRRPSRRRWPP